MEAKLIKNPKKENIWYLYGKAYDLSTFLNSHPGGR
jgi:cytochrome b involved in lipid metabolism